MMTHILRIFLFFLLPIGVVAQSAPPPEEVGVFMEILDDELINGITTSTDSLNVRFNGYNVISDISSVDSLHIKLEVNDTSTILLDFITALDGTGLPQGVEIFEEEGIWYITTGSFTGINNYRMGTSLIYNDGSESIIVYSEIGN